MTEPAESLVQRADTLTERAARWLAARTSRRSFLGGLGKAAVVAVGGSLVADALSRQADARVCGQSGVAPKCPTYDCDEPNVWGYCWYASPGCCVGGGLKKICDCCRVGWDFTHGYCPEGANVYCVMESCLEDPRVMSIPVRRIPTGSAEEITIAKAQSLQAGSVRHAVVAMADPVVVSIAAALAARLGAPVLLLDGDASVSPRTRDELTRLGVRTVSVVRTDPAPTSIAGLPASVTVERTVTAPDVAALSVEVAIAAHVLVPLAELVVLGVDAPGVAVASSAGAYAAVAKGALVIGPDAARSVRDRLNALASPPADLPVTVVSQRLSGTTASANTTNGTSTTTTSTTTTSTTTTSTTTVGTNTGVTTTPPRSTEPSTSRADLSPAEVAGALAARATGAASAPIVVAVAPAPSLGPPEPVAALAAACMIPTTPPGCVVLYDRHGLGLEVRPVMRSARARVARAEVLLRGNVISNDPRVFDGGNRVAYELQSDLHGFEEQLLTGLSGEGLPVIAQPLDERERGRARVSGVPAASGSPATTLAVVSRAAKKKTNSSVGAVRR